MSKSAAATDNWDEVKAASASALPEEIVAYIRECSRSEHPESSLISVLHRVQAHFGYLGGEQLDAVAQLMQIPAAKVTGVATFYHFFRLEPKGRYTIHVCMGTACYVKGADRLVEKLKEELGIGFGETTQDGLFTLEASRCLGTCGLAPVLMVGTEIHGKVAPDQVSALVARYIKRSREDNEKG
jgi:NADH:ubiquinone oxidoreductase subunit E